MVNILQSFIVTCPSVHSPVLKDGDLLDEVPALDPHLLLGEQVLDDHVRHVLAVGVPACTHN